MKTSCQRSHSTRGTALKGQTLKGQIATRQGTTIGRPAIGLDEFEDVLVAELEELRKSERVLQEMYPRLKSKPQLRVAFLRQLADVQRRTQRLDAVLNPIGAMQFAPAPAQSAFAL